MNLLREVVSVRLVEGSSFVVAIVDRLRLMVFFSSGSRHHFYARPPSAISRIVSFIAVSRRNSLQERATLNLEEREEWKAK
jgi:hypothetical protein